MKRCYILISAWIVLQASASFANGQVYLVTGAQTPKTTASFSSSLWKVSDDGRLQMIGQIASKESGLFWLEVSYDTQSLVALTRAPLTGDQRSFLAVVDFEKGTITKRCPVPLRPANYIGIEEWLAQLPSGKLALIDRLESIGAAAGTKEMVRAILVDPSIPCESSVEMITPSDSSAVVLNGRAAIDNIAANDAVVFGIDGDGSVVRKFRDGANAYLGFQIPQSMRSGQGRSGAHVSIMINNRRVLVAVVGGSESDKAYRILALRKNDLTWHVVPNPSDGYPWTRSFGHYLAIPEGHTKSASYPESTGVAEWRNKPSDTGPNIKAVFDDSEFAYSGRLHLYDVDTEQTYVIETKQADSEILLGACPSNAREGFESRVLRSTKFSLGSHGDVVAGPIVCSRTARGRDFDRKSFLDASHQYCIAAWSRKMLCVRHSSAHSPFTFSFPRSKN